MSDEPRPFASLSSSLLARKGGARPAMRPQAIQLTTGNADPLDDLGWNDMGEQALHGTMPAAPTPVAIQHAEIERSFAPEPVKLSPPQTHGRKAFAGGKAKAAFTLRLDPDRHLQLRLLCAVRRQSAQQLVIEALDEFLNQYADELVLPAAIRGTNPTTGDL